MIDTDFTMVEKRVVNRCEELREERIKTKKCDGVYDHRGCWINVECGLSDYCRIRSAIMEEVAKESLQGDCCYVCGEPFDKDGTDVIRIWDGGKPRTVCVDCMPY